MSGHLLGNSCPISGQFVLIVFCLFVIFISSRFGFKSCLSNAPVLVIGFSITFLINNFFALKGSKLFFLLSLQLVLCRVATPHSSVVQIIFYNEWNLRTRKKSYVQIHFLNKF